MSFLYKLFYALCWALALLPLRVLYVISDFLFLIVCYVVRYRRAVVMENLQNSFPEKTKKEHRQIARKFYRFMCDRSEEHTSELQSLTQYRMPSSA